MVKYNKRVRKMDFEKTKLIIERAFDNNEDVNPNTTGEVKEAINSALNFLDKGELRVAEPTGDSQWKVNQWLKKAVLLSFKINDMDIISGGPQSSNIGPTNWWDKYLQNSQDGIKMNLNPRALELFPDVL